MKDLIEQIKDNAKSYPLRTSVIDGDREISFGKLIEMVNSISNKLNVLSSKPKVLFDLPQCIESYALILSVLQIDGVFCPMPASAPLHRKMQIYNEFCPDFLIVESAEDYDGVSVIEIKELCSEKEISDVNVVPSEESISYVIYTSGTTGTPKGVQIARKSINKFLEWSIPTYSAGENDRWAQYSLLSFDLSLVDIFTSLCSGSILCIVKKSSDKSIPSSFIERYGITIWQGSPMTVSLMMKREKSKKANLSSLRLMSFCGAPLTKSHVEFLFSKNQNLDILNTYGPSEGTMFCTWQKIRHDNFNEFSRHTVSIGTCIPGWNIELVKLDESDDLEVVIYGEYIGKGYTRNVPDSGFVETTIANKKVSAYYTGDIVYREAGNLFFESRKDRQVKINGNRIELEEIEYFLREFFNEDCVVLFFENKLTGFIETDDNLDKNRIMTFLKSKLEHYKVPKQYFAVAEIPKTVNAKIDYKTLQKKIFRMSEKMDPYLLVATALKTNKESLTIDSEMHDHPNWDSIENLEIVVALEKEYGISIDDECIMNYTSMRAILELYENLKED